MNLQKDTIKSITIYPQVLDILRDSCRDRLGLMISFDLVMYPNAPISALRCLEWFKHILAVVGYTHEHIKDLKFEEQAECWIFVSSNYDEMYVQHKYWSYNTTKLVFELLRTYAILNGIPFKEEFRR
jgi:hypothetical protein